jgi:hypothetical protein
MQIKAFLLKPCSAHFYSGIIAKKSPYQPSCACQGQLNPYVPGSVRYFPFNRGIEKIK